MDKDKDKVVHLHVAGDVQDPEDPIGDEARASFQAVIDDLQARLDANDLAGVMVIGIMVDGDVMTSRVLRGEDIPEFYLTLDQIKLSILFEAADLATDGD